MNLRQINKKDIVAIALLHKQSFDKTHFTAFFSNELLCRYIKVLIDYNPYSYLAEEKNIILGYLIGGNKTGTALDNFKRNNYLKIIFTLLLHPRFILEKMKSIFLNMNKMKVSDVEYKIYIIASLPKEQGKGIGKELIKYFENELRLKEIKEYGLSVREQNNKAISFYENNSFIRINKINKSIYYRKIL